MADGTAALLYRLENEQLQVDVTNYGARLVSLVFKDTLEHKHQQVILGQWSLAEYEQDMNYVGAIVGRTCNRIENARFELAGSSFELDTNEGRHHLHGGSHGFHNRCWRGTAGIGEVLFEVQSLDGESGYPGTVNAWVRIGITDATLHYEFGGTTDQLTLLDMTNHAYFCLDDSGDVRAHELEIQASRFAVVNAELIPTGELRSVAETPFDFRSSKPLGQDIDVTDEQLSLAQGYDHAYLLDHSAASAATLYSAKSNIEMKVTSDSPALQFYTGNFLPCPRSALCLETQHLPNACNQQGFAAPICAPDKPYQAHTSYHFRRRI